MAKNPFFRLRRPKVSRVYSCLATVRQPRNGIKKRNPAKDFRYGYHDGNDQSGLRSMENAAWRIPVSNRDKQRHRCRYDCENPEYYCRNREHRQTESDAVPFPPAGVEILDSTFGLSGFEAARAKVLPVELAVTQCTQKSAARFAGQHGLF
jgi:hypothetical protein